MFRIFLIESSKGKSVVTWLVMSRVLSRVFGSESLRIRSRRYCDAVSMQHYIYVCVLKRRLHGVSTARWACRLEAMCSLCPIKKKQTKMVRFDSYVDTISYLEYASTCKVRFINFYVLPIVLLFLKCEVFMRL